MIGDKLVVTDFHREGARRIWDVLYPRLGTDTARPLVVSVAGESGSGKSETAHCLGELIEEQGLRFFIFAQDDYFVLPPRSNHERRLADLEWVGPQEVRLDLLDDQIESIRARPNDRLEKPLVFFAENRIGSETIDPSGLDVLIVEGTYTTLLRNADLRAFIDRTYRQSRAAREVRARDPDLDFLEKVLAIEHEEISGHKARADIVIPAPEDELHLR
jgi:uridine kinase